MIVENLLLLNRVCWKEGLVLESLLEDRDNGSSAFEIKREKNSTGRIRSSGTQLFLIGISAFSQIEFIRTGKKGEFQVGAQRWKSAIMCVLMVRFYIDCGLLKQSFDYLTKFI